jgi:hypothetical protein
LEFSGLSHAQENVLPKENTHVLLVNRIINALDCGELKTLMQTNYESVCFGSIVADTFFYSSNKDVVRISEELHGKEGEKTNEIIFVLLDHARQYMSGKLLCLTMGYISHCVFDIIFHPVIYSLTGNYYDKDTERSDHAVYRHRLIETKLDKHINGTYCLDKILDVNDNSVQEVLNIIAIKYKVSKGELIRTLNKQLSCNRSFRNDFIYRLIYILNKINLLNYRKILPLFYGHLHRDEIEIGEIIRYRDMLSGQEKEVRLTELLKAAENESIKRISAAYAYYNTKIDKADAMQIIRGESLDTGKEGCSVNELTTSNG